MLVLFMRKEMRCFRKTGVVLQEPTQTQDDLCLFMPWSGFIIEVRMTEKQEGREEHPQNQHNGRYVNSETKLVVNLRLCNQ